MDLKHYTDQTLLDETKRLARVERDVTTRILHHIREIDRRKLFSDLGYKSLMEYARFELGYAESSAYRRIQAARLLAHIPEVEPKITKGDLNITNLTLAAGFFRRENIKDIEKKRFVIKQIENLSTRETERVLLQLGPAHPLPREEIRIVTPEYHQMKVNLSQETLDLLNEAKDHLGLYFLDDLFFKKIAGHAIPAIKKKKYKV